MGLLRVGCVGILYYSIENESHSEPRHITHDLN